jgi:hypothetical protein
VSGANTTSVPVSGDLNAALNNLFTGSSVWMRAALAGSNAASTPVVGSMALTAMQLRIVLQDQLFVAGPRPPSGFLMVMVPGEVPLARR